MALHHNHRDHTCSYGKYFENKVAIGYHQDYCEWNYKKSNK